MLESAHFSQFLSFSFGLVAIYVCFMHYKTSPTKTSYRLLNIVIAISAITFIHALEAFLKLILVEESMDENPTVLPEYTIFILAIIRYYIAYLFIRFTLEINNKKSPNIITTLFIIAFILFFILNFQEQSITNLFAQNLFKFSVHFVYAVIFMVGAAIIIFNKKATLHFFQDNKLLFFGTIFIYGFIYLFLRSIPLLTLALSENLQMLLLAAINTVFFLNIILFIKPQKQSKINATNSENNREAIYLKYNITEREKEVIQLICKGKTNNEIAEKLFISPVTVRDHLSRIYKKVKISNRTQLSNKFK